MIGERYIALRCASDRADTLAWLTRAIRLDDAAVVRASLRSDGMIGLWAHTGFEVLATRAVFGEMAPGDIVCDAAGLRSALAVQSAEAPPEPVDPGMPLDSAWKGALPIRGGYQHLDDVPARTVVELSRDGARLARTEGSAHGPATGLLDQDVLDVASADGRLQASVTMRSLFALTAMGFIRDQNGREVTETSPVEAIDASEPVRVRLSAAWIRIDARYGAVYQRRHRDLDVSVL